MNLLEKKPIASLTEEELQQIVKSYLTGDQKSFVILVRYFEPVIRNVIFTKKYPGAYENSEDVRQECLIELYKSIPKWDPTRGTLKNFMFKCFSNRAMQYLHRTSQFSSNAVSLDEIPNDILMQEDLPKEQDLDISIFIRFNNEREKYIFRIVCTAVYFRYFDEMRGRIVEYLRELTGYKQHRIRFLIDYSLVVLRMHYWRNYEPKEFRLRAY